MYCGLCVGDSRENAGKITNSATLNNCDTCFIKCIRRTTTNPAVIDEYNNIDDNKLIQVFLTEAKEAKVEVPQTRLIPPLPTLPNYPPPPPTNLFSYILLYLF